MKSVELEECIISPFKINLNIYIIYKTIKIQISTRKNQNIRKEDTKNNHNRVKNSQKGIIKIK